MIDTYSEQKTYETARVIAEALYCIRQYGYTPSSQADFMPPTVDRVKARLSEESTPEVDSLTLEAHVLMMLTAEIEPRDDFTAAVQYCASLPEVTTYSVGLLSYLPEMHARAQLQEALPPETNAHLGEPGERITRDVMFCRTRMTASGMPILEFADVETGARLVWFTQGLLDPKPGQTLHASFTVRRHDTYRGKNSTIISRLTEKQR